LNDQGWKSVIFIFRPAVFNRNILLLDVTRLPQSLPKGTTNSRKSVAARKHPQVLGVESESF
jgi:hypothetical protein